MKRKIVIVNGSGGGGAERISVLYAKILMENGYDCKMIVQVKPGDTPNIMNFIPSSLPCELVTCRYRYFIFYLVRFLIKEKPDIVFCSMPTFNRLLYIIRKSHVFGFKYITRCFNMPSKMTKTSYDLIKYYKTSDVIISQTEEMKEEIINHFHFPSTPIITINNPIDKELIKKNLKEKFEMDYNFVNFVAVGRVVKQKDYNTLIRAFSILRNNIPMSRLYIIGNIGSIPLYEELVLLIKKLNIANYIFWEGFQSNPFKYVNASDVYCLSSTFEGLPNALLEAMYIGKPVVATRCIPYIQQVVHDAVNGYTCEIGNVEELAAAMYNATRLRNIKKFVDVNKTENKIIELFNKVYLCDKNFDKSLYIN